MNPINNINNHYFNNKKFIFSFMKLLLSFLIKFQTFKNLLIFIHFMNLLKSIIYYLKNLMLYNFKIHKMVINLL